VSYRERQRLSDIQAAIDAIRSHLQRGDLSDGLICQVWRYARYDVARHGRTECREAIPRSIPTRRLNGGCPSSCSTSYLSSMSSGSSSPGAQQAATHRPRSQERKSPGNGSHSCAATGPDSDPGWTTSLMRVIRGQASSGNQIREAPDITGLRTFVVATYRTSRGCSCNPGTPS